MEMAFATLSLSSLDPQHPLVACRSLKVDAPREGPGNGVADAHFGNSLRSYLHSRKAIASSGDVYHAVATGELEQEGSSNNVWSAEEWLEETAQR